MSVSVGATSTQWAAATRGSALARWQTDHVAAALAACGVAVGSLVIDTRADRDLSVPIWAMGGKGVFVSEVQAAVLDGRARIAVHSAKDLPSVTAPGLVLAAVPARADVRDVLVGGSLDGLATGATVATGSLRRRAQLAWLRPDLTFTGLRGNISTRLRRVPDGGAVVVAKAALDRLGLLDGLAVEHQVLDPRLVVPQVGQAALAVECRADDDEARAVLSSIDDPVARRAVETERAFLAELGGDCDLPAGATAVADGASTTLLAVLASPDGHVVLRHRAEGQHPASVGRSAAQYLLAHGGELLLDRSGPARPAEPGA